MALATDNKHQLQFLLTVLYTGLMLVHINILFSHHPAFPFQGRFTIAAKHHITIAEIYESEIVDIEKVSSDGVIQHTNITYMFP